MSVYFKGRYSTSRISHTTALQNPDSDCVTIQFFKIVSKKFPTLGLKPGLNREKTPIICVFLFFPLHFDYRTLIVTESEWQLLLKEATMLAMKTLKFFFSSYSSFPLLFEIVLSNCFVLTLVTIFVSRIFLNILGVVMS